MLSIDNYRGLDHLGYADASVRRPIWLVWIVRMLTIGIVLTSSLYSALYQCASFRIKGEAINNEKYLTESFQLGIFVHLRPCILFNIKRPFKWVGC